MPPKTAQPQSLTASATPVLIRPEDVERLAKAPALDRANARVKRRYPRLR